MTPATLLGFLLSPARLLTVDAATLNAVIRAARMAGVIGRLAVEAEKAGCLEAFPAPVDDMLGGELRRAAFMERVIRFEADRVAHAFLGSRIKVCLLKGGAYLLAGDGAAAGRISTDLDILVSRDDLDEAEKRLLAAGWAFAPKTNNPYDQHYYRAWMHELPPLLHWKRGHMLDLHHTILPPSGRIAIDGHVLLAGAEPAPGLPLFVLHPVDRLLHSIAHLWQDGDFQTPLRNILEQYDLAREHGLRPEFWESFAERARLLGLEAPAGHALHMLKALAPGIVPEKTLSAFRGRPAARHLFHRLVLSAATPERFGRPNGRQAFARFLLYLRSHWLRMPPALLMRHLWTKARTGKA